MVKWAEDKAVKYCSACGFQFNVLIRRHHCRACGKLFCKHCCSDRWPLPKFDYNSAVRVCVECRWQCLPPCMLVVPVLFPSCRAS